MSKHLFLALLLGLALLSPVPCFGLTPQEKEDLKKTLSEYKSIQKLLLEKYQESETALTKAQTYSGELEQQKQELTLKLEELGKRIKELEQLLEDSQVSMNDLENGLKNIEQERDIWRIAGIGGLVLGGISIFIMAVGGSK